MSKNERILLVVNPISGGIDKSEIIDYLREKLPEEDNQLTLYTTTAKGDKEQLIKIVKAVEPHRILIAGGDGTIKLIAEILGNSTIPVGLLPVGSANGLAENLKLPTELEEIVRIALGEHFVELDCIEVNGELCLHISDIGLNAELIRNYEEGNIRGKLGYLIQSIPTLIKSDFPFNFKISIGGEVFYRKAFLLGIANAKRYGTGATINPDGKFDDGLFEILVFKKFDIPEILKTFQEDSYPSEDFLEVFSASNALVECEKKLPFQIDGEYRGEVTSVQAKISTVRLKIAVPPSP